MRAKPSPADAPKANGYAGGRRKRCEAPTGDKPNSSSAANHDGGSGGGGGGGGVCRL